MISEAKLKDTWVNELDISKRFYEFSVERFERLKWLKEIDLHKCDQQFKQIAHDVLMGTDNSLFRN
jgi:hypothetical protein